MDKAELSAMIGKMMARKPDERFPTPIEAAEALQPFAQINAPAAPGVVMAMPVVAVGNVPMAQPILAMPLPTPEEATEDTAVMPSPVPAPTREAALELTL